MKAKAGIMNIQFNKQNMIMDVVDKVGFKKIVIGQEYYKGGARTVVRMDGEIIWYSPILKKFNVT